MMGWAAARVADALGDLQRFGLAHSHDGFAFASVAAARFEALAL